MARLKIGDGIKFEAQLPQAASEQPSGTDVMALIEKAVAALPKPAEPPKEVDLSGLATKDEVTAVANKVANQHVILDNKIDKVNREFNNLVEVIDAADDIVHVDMGPDIIDQCKELIKLSEKRQKINNIFLMGLLVVSILMHLI